jgi:hypothetical protein
MQTLMRASASRSRASMFADSSQSLAAKELQAQKGL